ncbi:unnamed protein product [Gadus morhua 'NCC']
MTFEAASFHPDTIRMALSSWAPPKTRRGPAWHTVHHMNLGAGALCEGGDRAPALGKEALRTGTHTRARMSSSVCMLTLITSGVTIARRPPDLPGDPSELWVMFNSAAVTAVDPHGVPATLFKISPDWTHFQRQGKSRFSSRLSSALHSAQSCRLQGMRPGHSG